MAHAPAHVAPAGAARTRSPLFTRRAVVGMVIFFAVLLVFLTQTRLPALLRKFPTLDRGATGRDRVAFSQVVNPNDFPRPLRFVAFGINLWDANAIGMFFAILLGGAGMTAFSPGARMRELLGRRKGPLGAGLGGAMGLPLFMCSACSAPVSMGIYKGGASLETSLGVIFGSALFNPVGVLAIFLVLTPQLGLARIGFGIFALTILAPLLSRWHHGPKPPLEITAPPVGEEGPPEPWAKALGGGIRDWARNTGEIALRLVPPMLVAGFGVGVVLSVASPQILSESFGKGLGAIAVTAALGTLLQLPTLFEIPLVVGAIALGLGAGPAAALLVTAPSAGIVTLAVTQRELGWRTPLLLLAGTLVGGVITGLVIELL